MSRRKSNDHHQSRRAFLCRSACASMGVSGMVNTLAHLKLVQRAVAATPFTDYKAMVCVFLFGGNDSNNMLIPLDGVARTNYNAGRPAPADFDVDGSGADTGTSPWRSVHIPVNALNTGQPNAIPLTPLSGGFGQTHATQFGVHPRFQRVADMFNTGDLAFVSNVGTLVQPIADRAAYLSAAVKKPPQLFSHSDQQLQWQSSIPDRPFDSGWAGRVMDALVGSGYEDNDSVSMNISLGGQNSFQVGRQFVQYGVGTAGASSLIGYSGTPNAGVPTAYGNAIQSMSPYTYKTTTEGRRLEAFEKVMNLTHEHLLDEGYNTIMRRARANEDLITQALALATGPNNVTNSQIDTYFTNAHAVLEYGETASMNLSSLSDQLRTVAKLMRGKSVLGKTTGRQIFFVTLGGFDTHQAQAFDIRTGQGLLLAQIDRALKGFKDSLTAMGLWDSTVLYTNSDFTRTLVPNGSTSDANTGTDHSWGGHQIVAGGPVIGQKIYGKFPDLDYNLSNPTCMSTSNRGSWIPTTSVDQYSAVIAKWFGVPSDLLHGPTGIFPNLSRFNVGADPSTPSAAANLAFL